MAARWSTLSRVWRRRQVHRHANSPGVPDLDEPVDETAAVVDELTIDAHFGILNSGCERSVSDDVDHELLERDRHDLARNLGNGFEKRRRVCRGPAGSAVNKPIGEQGGERSGIARADRGRDPMGAVLDGVCGES